MPDPLESFRLSNTPVAPRPEFTRALRAELERMANADDEGNTTMTTAPTTTSTTSTTLAPYLTVRNTAAAIDFYVRAFGAEERYRLVGPDGRVGHADLVIGGQTLMLADEYPEYGVLAPESIGGSPVSLHLEVPDVDTTVARAVEAGATLERPVAREFYGARSGTLRDPFGHRWTIQTHVEDVTPEQMTRRWHESERDS
jgi:PhnB protein